MVSHQQNPVLLNKLLSREDLKIGLDSVALKPCKRNFCQQLQRKINNNASITEESQRAEELLSFAKSKKTEKLLSIVNADIPTSILPSDCNANILDIRIGKSGPDDKVYSKHPDIQRMIPRGTAILQWHSSKGSWSSVVIYGHKKFTGGIGDEDNEQPETNEKWHEYFVTDHKKATSVVCMEKLNGEAAHISCRYIDDQFYLIVGSKNVHMLIRGTYDIDLYEGSRYEYAKVIARSFCDTLTSLDAHKRDLILSFLHYTRCTLVGEILQTKNQHIVNLSHLSKSEVVVISVTSTFTGHQMDNLLAMPPHHLLEMCRSLGLTIASYTTIPVAKVLEQRTWIRKQKNREGEVFYYLDKNENTIGLVKVKTVWYVILRALREKAVFTFNAGKKRHHWNLSEYIKSTRKRFMEIQKWLKFSDEYLQNWQNLAESFFHWLDEEIKEKREEPGAIRPLFPVIWNRFLKVTQKSDQIELDFI